MADIRTPEDPSLPVLTPGGRPAAPTAQDAALARLLGMLPALRILIGALLGALVMAALYLGRDLLIPLALAILFGFLLDPAVSRLTRWRMPRMAAVLIVVTLTLLTLGAGTTYLGTQLTQLSQDLPTYQDTIRNKLHGLRQMVSGPSIWDGALSTFETFKRELALDKADAGAAGARSDRPATRAPAAPQAGSPPVQRVEFQQPTPKPTDVALEWLVWVGGPAATAGIILLFVILILLDRVDLRDRMLRLMGVELDRATDLVEEASVRIGRYLRMQLAVNVSYGVPMAVGLMLIGVPGAVLWGVVAAVMRFVPYIGPLVSAVFPIALALAVDPGWSMLLWTIGLIVVLELISNNIIEPWLYGSSTGLSTLSIILAASFWTSLWGPAGLILSTPLTVCLLVLGRHVPGLRFLEILLGSQPALRPPRRLYQRLVADEAEDAFILAREVIDDGLGEGDSPLERATAVTRFYDEVAIPALRIASEHHSEQARAEHRLRLDNGMAELIDELEDAYRPEVLPAVPRLDILTAGVRWEVDARAAALVAHALRLHGHPGRAIDQPLAGAAPEVLAGIGESTGRRLLCLSVFAPRPQAPLRALCRELRRQAPGLLIHVAAWQPGPEWQADGVAAGLGVDAVVTSLHELVLRVESEAADALGAPGSGAGERGGLVARGPGTRAEGGRRDATASAPAVGGDGPRAATSTAAQSPTSQSPVMQSPGAQPPATRSPAAESELARPAPSSADASSSEKEKERPQPAPSLLALPIPESEAERLEALRRSGALDVGLVDFYGETARRAANAFDVAFAQVAWVDSERVWLPGSRLRGALSEEGQPVLDREDSIAAHVVGRGEPLVVTDLDRDPRFSRMPIVQAQNLRFFAGVPLRDKKGRALGCLSLLDTAPRVLAEDELELLEQMGREVMDGVRQENGRA